jgi:hypothetical protein
MHRLGEGHNVFHTGWKNIHFDLFAALPVARFHTCADGKTRQRFSGHRRGIDAGVRTSNTNRAGRSDANRDESMMSVPAKVKKFLNYEFCVYLRGYGQYQY